MITVDPKILNITEVGKVGKNFKNTKKIKFNGKKTGEIHHGEVATNVADIGSMLFLQEIDETAQDRQNLEEFAEKAFKELRHLQLDLLQGKISERSLLNLQNVLSSKMHKIKSSELASLAEDIKLRIAVEIAKIEINKK